MDSPDPKETLALLVFLENEDDLVSLVREKRVSLHF